MTRRAVWPLLSSFVQKHREPVMYVLCGAMSTLVDFLAYLVASRWFLATAAVSTLIANLTATGFAYVVNKRLVFLSSVGNWRRLLLEITAFFLSRAVAIVTQTAFMWLTVDVLRLPDLWMKGIITLVIIVMNYATSKWIVFARRVKK